MSGASNAGTEPQNFNQQSRFTPFVNLLLKEEEIAVIKYQRIEKNFRGYNPKEGDTDTLYFGYRTENF